MTGLLKYTLIVRNPESLTPEALLAGQPVPEWASDLVHADDLDAGGEDEGAEVKPYAKWRKADLESEVESRNEDRADDALIVVDGKGTVANLAAALDADDADADASPE